ncbi:MAG: 30S ribosomal protein S6 [Deltaproteobacteria bacterium]|nr:30S ribosomal protein S6 [Deltaproteobacteria bacterium]
MLREYEVTIIVNAQLSPDASKKTLEKYEEIILQDGGAIVRKAEWGFKKLAFPIKGQFRGRYIHYDLSARPEHLKEAERLMRIDENVLRYLNVRIGENVDVNERKAELARAEAKAAAAAAEQNEAV